MGTPRPTTVTTIGWLAVGVGVLSIVSAAMGLLVSSAIPTLDQVPGDHSVGFPYWIFQHFTAIALAQTAVGATTMIAGVGFLRLRPWARACLEVLAWLFLLANLAFGAFWVRSAYWFTDQIRREGAVPLSPALFAAIGAIVLVAATIPIVLVIRILRGRPVRDAITAHSGMGPRA